MFEAHDTVIFLTSLILWSKFLVNDQRDTQFFPVYLFLFLTPYMFRAHRAHHQERRCSLLTCTRHGHRHRVTAAGGCIDTILSPDDEHDVGS